jgi:hypothetical protein
MTDAFPRWPPDWLDEHDLSTEEELGQVGEVEFLTGLRSDGQVLMSVTWPEGRRYMLVDPVGNEGPRALRVGEKSEDPDVARMVEGVWSQALSLAKQLIDGDIQSITPPAPGRSGRRGWRRGQG